MCAQALRQLPCSLHRCSQDDLDMAPQVRAARRTAICSRHYEALQAGALIECHQGTEGSLLSEHPWAVCRQLPASQASWTVLLMSLGRACTAAPAALASTPSKTSTELNRE